MEKNIFKKLGNFQTDEYFEDFIRLNVSGRRFCLLRKSLLRYPETLLGEIASESHEKRLYVCDTYFHDTQEYCFYRSHRLFDLILSLYRVGTIHIPDFACQNQLETELAFWRIKKTWVSPCCSHKLKADEITDHHDAVSAEPCSTTQLISRPSRYIFIRQHLWNILEYPETSLVATGFMIISCIVIVTTVFILVLSSMPGFQEMDSETGERVVIKELEYTDMACVVWFTLEYLLRLFAAPNRCAYARAPLSIIDLIAIVPCVAEMIFMQLGIASRTFGNLRRSLITVRILRALRIFRILRVLKVARYSRGFQTIGETLIRSWKELTLLVMFILTTTLIFSTAMYFIEAETPGSMFDSIPSACWWCIITMTTVGYGDVYPVTVIGKLLAALASICGIILLAFPISVIVDNFNQSYHDLGQSDNQSEKTKDPWKFPQGIKLSKPSTTELVDSSDK